MFFFFWVLWHRDDLPKEEEGVCERISKSKIVSKFVNFINHGENIFFACGWIGYNCTKEIRMMIKTLITNHHCSLSHHTFFDSRSNLRKRILDLFFSRLFTLSNRSRYSTLVRSRFCKLDGIYQKQRLINGG